MRELPGPSARDTTKCMTTISVILHSSLTPDRALQSACDFSERRADVFPAVSVQRMTVHELGDSWADVTEGTRAGPIVNWERCRYDWSEPGSVKAIVTDSNVYAFPGSYWEMRASDADGGSRIEMIWAREFARRPRGRLFGFAFDRFGQRLFDKYGREILENLERLDRAG
jgi:hypothetical protein